MLPLCCCIYSHANLAHVSESDLLLFPSISSHIFCFSVHLTQFCFVCRLCMAGVIRGACILRSNRYLAAFLFGLGTFLFYWTPSPSKCSDFHNRNHGMIVNSVAFWFWFDFNGWLVIIIINSATWREHAKHRHNVPQEHSWSRGTTT